MVRKPLRDDASTNGAAGARRPKRRLCPICGHPAVERLRPFCSLHCADVDLGRWLGEQYRIPVMDDEDVLEDEARE